MIRDRLASGVRRVAGWISEERLGGETRIQKMNRALPVILADYFGQEAIAPPEDFGEYAEMYRVNPWSYAATYAISTAASTVPWGLYRKLPNGEREEVSKHWVADLLAKPNPRRSFARILFSTFGFLELTGDGFWALEKERSARPNEIWVLRPDKVQPIAHPVNEISGYRYTNGWKQVDYEEDEVVHFDYWNPTNEFHGQGSITAGRNALISDIHATEWNKRTFRQGIKGLAVIAKEEMEKPQIQRLKERIIEQLRGPDKWRNVEVFYGVDFKEIGFTAQDVEFLGLKEQSTIEILACHGVPPSMVGVLKYANYANLEAQRKIFWENLQIKLVLFRDALNVQFVQKIDPALFVDFDLSGVDALQEDRNQRVDRQVKQLGAGLRTRNELRAEDGYDPVDGGDAFYLPISWIEVGAEPAPENGSAPATAAPSEEPQNDVGAAGSKIVADSVIGAWEVAFGEREGAPGGRGLSQKDDEIRNRLSRLPDPRDEAKTLEPKVRPLRLKAAVLGSERILDLVSAGKGKAAKASGEDYDILLDPLAVERIRVEGAKKALYITKTMARTIRSTLAEGMAAGESLTQLTDRVDEATAALERARYWALRIARTETRSGQSFGAFRTMEAVGVEKKVWLSAQDENTRELHLATDLESNDNPVAIGENFQPIDAPYPGGSGREEDDINERCDVAPWIPGLEGKARKAWNATFRSLVDRGVARLEGEWVAPLHAFLEDYAERAKRAIR